MSAQYAKIILTAIQRFSYHAISARVSKNRPSKNRYGQDSVCVLTSIFLFLTTTTPWLAMVPHMKKRY
jgi:hypothetical protein